jgi:hypothetical protein
VSACHPALAQADDMSAPTFKDIMGALEAERRQSRSVVATRLRMTSHSGVPH